MELLREESMSAEDLSNHEAQLLLEAQNCSKHDSVDSAVRIELVQKYHTWRDTIASLMATNAGWVLPPTASDKEKKTKEDQVKALRKLARTAEADYLHLLVTFQYGAEGTGALPETESFSLVPPEIKKKLELKKKEELKKRKDEEAIRKQDLASRANETYGPSRYKSTYRPRSEAGLHPPAGTSSGLGYTSYPRAGYTSHPGAGFNHYSGAGNGPSTSSLPFFPYNSVPGLGLQAPGLQGGWIAHPQDGFAHQALLRDTDENLPVSEYPLISEYC